MNEVFAKNLKSIRKDIRGLTQDRAAKLARISRPSWGAYEEGRAFPPADKLMRIADVLGVADVAAFVNDENFDISKSAPIRPRRPHILTDVQRAYENLTIRDKLAVNLLLGLVDLSDPS